MSIRDRIRVLHFTKLRLITNAGEHVLSHGEPEIRDSKLRIAKSLTAKKQSKTYPYTNSYIMW